MTKKPPIRVLTEEPPSEVSRFLRLSKHDKDPDQFWSWLREWYRAGDSNLYAARWDGLVFPYVEGDDRFPGADFNGVTFIGRSAIRGVEFPGPAMFSDAIFERGVGIERSKFLDWADFTGARFKRGSLFNQVTFHAGATFLNSEFDRGCEFKDCSFGGDFNGWGLTTAGDFRFVGCTVSDALTFVGTFFGGSARFLRSDLGSVQASDVTFVGSADFSLSRLREGSFIGVTIADDLTFGLTIQGDGTLELTRITATPADDPPEYPSDGPFVFRTAGSKPPRVILGRMSLGSIVLQEMDMDQVRFRQASDVSQLRAYDVSWRRSGLGYRIADEDDLEAVGLPSPEEVERLYRGLRKAREDLNDRVGAHGWYYAEMEVGRRYAPIVSLRRWARSLYKWMSGYGLSALRPLAWLLGVGLLALILFSLGPGWCPRSRMTNECLGLEQSSVVVLRALLFLPPQDEVALIGIGVNVAWLFARIVGAAMLVFLGIAFRNQVAR